MLPLDGENWNTDITTKHFYRVFGVYIGILVLHDLDREIEYSYLPQYYFDQLYKRIDEIKGRNYKALEKILKRFYPLKIKAKREIPKLTVKNFKTLTNKQLASIFKKNRSWAHLITTYDQFGWTAENYWEPYMDNVLANKLGIEKDSNEYHRVLFALTKPAEISTTLEEKRDSILEAWKIKTKKKTIKQASAYLAKKYGWMPVFAFGIPWDQEYYIGQLEVLTKQRIDKLDKEYKRLKYYTKNQQADIAQLRKKYKITVRDLQLFIDFGLALDVRNEAEYLVSLAGFYAMPIYREIARRLYISTTQLRKLVQDEIVKALAGEVIVQNILNKRGKIFGWGANPKMDKKIDFSDQESEKLLSYLNKKAVSIQGHDESQGKCASLGKVIGRVKIVNSPQENDKVKKGDILVCHVTTVDYLPAMKIAAGFVTEIGSLTCHAAVVAREFGVPCVVSLKNATKNFKDNDKVELDADKGTLRKVK